MPRPARVDYLQGDEETVLQERRRIVSVLDELLAGFVVLSVLVGIDLVVFLGFLPDLWLRVGLPVAAGIVLLVVWWSVVRWWHAATSLYTVTDTRVYQSHGRLRWFLSQTTFDKITDLHVKQGIFGRRLGFGDVRLMTAGTGLELRGVQDPFRVKRSIEDARTAFLHRLIGESTAAEVEATTDEQRRRRPATGMGDRRWVGRPAPASQLGRFVSAGIVAVLAFGLGGGLAFDNAAMGSLVLAGLLLLALFNMVQAILVVRYTRYHVHDGGVVVTAGWLTRRRVEATYSKVTDVQTNQGVLGRLLGFGEIRINTAGSNDAPIIFHGVADPERVKAIVDEARRAA